MSGWVKIFKRKKPFDDGNDPAVGEDEGEEGEEVDQAEEGTEKVRASGGYWRLIEMLMAGTQHRSKLQGRHNKQGTPANKLTHQ